MANPQKENGFTPIANEILEEIAKTRLNGTQYAIIVVLLRNSYGYNRKSCRLGDTFLSGATGINTRQLHREMEALLERKIIIITKAATFTSPKEVAFNKNYDDWVRDEATRKSTGVQLDTSSPIGHEYTNMTPVQLDTSCPNMSNTGVQLDRGGGVQLDTHKRNNKDNKEIQRSLLSEMPPACSDDRNFSLASDESMTSEAEPNEIGDGGYTRQEVLEGQNDTSGNIKAQQKSHKKAVYPHDSQYYKAAKWLADSIEDRVTDYKKHTEATLQSWADSARLLFERDKRDKKLVFELLKFSQEDDFWKNNILSMPKFREKFDVLKMRYDSKSDRIAANVVTAPAAKQNRFVNFTQRDIDYAELERLELEQLKAHYKDN